MSAFYYKYTTITQKINIVQTQNKKHCKSIHKNKKIVNKNLDNKQLKKKNKEKTMFE